MTKKTENVVVAMKLSVTALYKVEVDPSQERFSDIEAQKTQAAENALVAAIHDAIEPGWTDDKKEPMVIIIVEHRGVFLEKDMQSVIDAGMKVILNNELKETGIDGALLGPAIMKGK